VLFYKKGGTETQTCDVDLYENINISTFMLLDKLELHVILPQIIVSVRK
jgi:hypothetical protein